MGQVIKTMLQIYVPISNLDWMNYTLVKQEVTFHHIHKRSDGGKRVVSNGALLMPVGHQYLHLIESKDLYTYEALNDLFRVINKQGFEPTIEQRMLIEVLLGEFESEHRWDKGSKGKLLIQKKYYQRGFSKEVL